MFGINNLINDFMERQFDVEWPSRKSIDATTKEDGESRLLSPWVLPDPMPMPSAPIQHPPL
jgi:hypothetical protein